MEDLETVYVELPLPSGTITVPVTTMPDGFMQRIRENKASRLAREARDAQEAANEARNRARRLAREARDAQDVADCCAS